MSDKKHIAENIKETLKNDNLKPEMKRALKQKLEVVERNEPINK